MLLPTEDKDRLRDWLADPGASRVDGPRFHRWLSAVQQYISIRCVSFLVVGVGMALGCGAVWSVARRMCVCVCEYTHTHHSHQPYNPKQPHNTACWRSSPPGASPT